MTMHAMETICTRCEHGKVCGHTQKVMELDKKIHELCPDGEMLMVEVKCVHRKPMVANPRG